MAVVTSGLLVPALGAAQTCVPAPPGLVAWWPLDEATGTTAEDVVGGRAGTYAGDPLPSAGKVGGCLTFDGVDDHVVIPDSALWTFGSDEFTVELWVNFQDTASGIIGHPGDVFISHDEGPSNRAKWFLASSVSGLEFHVNGPGLGPIFSPIAPFTPVPGEWYHLAVTRTGTNYSLYVDGELLASDANAAVIPDAAAPLILGGTIEPFGGFFRGRLDEVGLYTRALTGPEIEAIYHAGSAGKCKELRIAPDRGGNSGVVTARIFGSGFTNGYSVKLVRDGSDVIAGDAVRAESSSTLVTTFDLTGASLGAWDVVVMKPDGTSSVIIDGFVVEKGRQADVSAGVVGLDVIRAGRAQTFYVVYRNRGNVDALGVPITLAGIPVGTTVTIASELSPVPSVDDQPPIGLDEVPLVFDLGTELAAPLFIPVVPAGSSGSIAIRLTTPVDVEGFSLRAWANTFAKGSLLQKLDAINCITDVIRKFLPPNVACAADVTDEATKLLGEIIFTKQFRKPTTYVQVLGEVFKSCTHVLDKFERVKTAVDTVDLLVNPVQLVPDSCLSLLPPAMPSELPLTPVGSFDPNDKVGSRGVGDARFLLGGAAVDYLIHFENLESATAPAQEVVISDQLDTEYLDTSTFRLGLIAFGDHQLVPSPGAREFAADFDLRPEQSLIVRVVAGLDETTGRVTWSFLSFDPTTGRPPEDPLTGFLPPDINPPEGEGAVLFTVSPRSEVPTDTEIANGAEITFDENAPVLTPVWSNTIDRSSPVSHVLPLSLVQKTETFDVGWYAEDDGAGVRDFSVFVSEDGGPFTAWLRNVPATTAQFTGEDRKHYAFFSTARDLVGNVEQKAEQTEAETDVILDRDGDGVPDASDACIDSILSSTVVVGDCDSGVNNQVGSDGCSVSDEIAQAAAEATNHGQFVRRVAAITDRLRASGAITGQQSGAIRNCAARAELP